MRQYLNSNTVANQIQMLREQFAGCFLIVEGDSDSRLYKCFVDQQVCKVINGLNKENAIGALHALELWDFKGVLCIVDSDFDSINGNVPSSLNLLMTDTHDLETMIIKSPAFDKLIYAYGSEAKISQLDMEVRDLVLSVGEKIGYLRLVSVSKGLNLKFDEVDFQKFIDKDTLEINIASMTKLLKQRSAASPYSPQELEAMITELSAQKHDPWHIACGHDLIEVLSIGLRKTLGTRSAQDVIPERLETSLRLSYEREHFSQTALFASIKHWENLNAPYHLL